MGRVVEQVIAQVLKHVDQAGIVVWYDPTGEYASVVGDLGAHDVHICCHEGSFFTLRRAIEPYVASEPRYDEVTRRIVSPRCVVYVPAARATTHEALIEAEQTGVVLEPGAPGARNTRLEVVARAALRHLPAEDVDRIVRGITEGSLKLADADRLAEQGVGGPLHLVAVFGLAEPQGIALRFLTDAATDEPLDARGALGELSDLLRMTFGFDGRPGDSAGEVRSRLARHVLLGALATEVPPDANWPLLKTLLLPASPGHRDACRRLAETWRDSERLRPSYLEAAERVQREYGLSVLDAEASVFSRVETFPFPGVALLHAAATALREGRLDRARLLARDRLAAFWPRTSPEAGLRWTLMGVAARFLLEAERVEAALATPPETVAEFVRSYASGAEDGGEPWCVIDHLHRTFARLHADLDPDGTVDLVARLVATRYAAIVDRMTTAFGERLLGAGREGSAAQANVFREHVEPFLAGQRVAYVLVDALRFEMARELALTLGPGYEARCDAAVACLPTITLVGMAALCPGAHEGVSLVERKGAVVALAGGIPLRDRKDRVQLIKTRATGRAVDVYLKDLQRPPRSVQSTVRGAQLVVVTSQEIDKFAEQGEDDHARAVMDSVLLHIKRAVRNLATLGVQRIVITADHGFLFGDAQRGEMTVDPPVGQTLELHRRVWIGRGGSSGASWVYRRAAELALGGDLEYAFPVSTAIFRGPGSRSYFHGGLSLQEVVVPVLTVLVRAPAPATTGAVRARLGMDRLRITSRLFSVAVEFEPDLMRSRPLVRCVARAGAREVAQAVAAEYGLREGTREVELGYGEDGQPRRNVVTLMFDGQPNFAAVSVHLLDADTQVELARIDRVPIAVTI